MNSAVYGKTCMVTGGGGSIGSELIRQAVKYGAKKVIIADIYENGVYDVCHDDVNIIAEIASVRDADKMEYLMRRYKPDIIFHAAAHKHVPFMEQNPEEAVKNNIRGTEIMLNLAEKYGAEKFVLISTDKAVEPVSVMGASKRVCEMLTYKKSLEAKNTVFTAVRFGNVINSNGSVIPLFKKQIEKGTVTVTDRNASRYFMTIPQAVSLILNSVEIASGGEIFVLDMGESVKILDIAEKMIKKSGKDVKIKFTGLRKGDKLCEKLFYDFETAENTSMDKIMRVRGSSIENLDARIEELYTLADKNDRAAVRELIMKITDKDLIGRI